MIEIYGRRDSSNCAKVFWVLDVMRLEYRLIETGGKHGGTNEAAYLALNPNGKVPTLVEDDAVIWESHAIMRYLAERHGPTPLYPQHQADRSRVDMWLDWVATTLNPALGTLRRAQTSEQAAASMPAAASAFTLLDAHLDSHPVMVGSDVTLADIALAPHVMRWLRVPHDRPRLPNVKAYRARLQDNEQFRRHMDDALDRD